MRKLRRHAVELRIPLSTVFVVLATALFVWAGLKLWLLIEVFLLSVLIAVTLQPAVAWLQRRRLSHWMAVVVIALGMLAVLAFFSAVLMPVVIRQIAEVVTAFPNIERQMLESTQGSPLLTRLVRTLVELPRSPEVRQHVQHPLSWGMYAGEAVGGLIALMVLTLYLLLDGKKLYAWLLAFVPRQHRTKLAETTGEVSGVVFAYVRGQAITSLLCALFTWVTLALFKVPAAVPLAVLAGIFDVIPFVGFISFTVPSVLMALVVSPMTALGVLGLFIAYHFVENYLIVPRVYGKELRLSTLAVIIALGVAGVLSGILGALLVLPLVAAYPIVERIWLRARVGPDVVDDHDALEKAAEEGSDRAVQQVIEGEEHPGDHDARHPM